ncbi:MAG: hypothetical protein BYD32DRAFT_403623 [Podila humilis]|nr:MAG: hypothetical protein BYD32DRAFT_403623 [Podila humilis]
MDVHDSLDDIIAAVPNHRQYHPGFVNQLVTALATHPEHHNNAASVAQHGKKVKRLVNQSLSTLTCWSKVLHSPEQTDVIARGVANSAVSTSTNYTTNSEPFATGTTNTTTAESTSGKNDRQGAATMTTRGARLFTKETRPILGTPNEINLPSRHAAAPIVKSKGNHSSMISKASSSTTIPGLTGTELSTGGSQKGPLGNNSGIASTESLYCTDRPTYAHIAMLVDISFLGIESLENMSQDISAATFEIEKARSNLASKIIELGMKKRALQELGRLKDRLVQGASILWAKKREESTGTARTQSMSPYSNKNDPGTAITSAESLKRTYQHLFSVSVPNFPSNALMEQTTATSTGEGSPTQTFTLLVVALQTNAIRCWMDVRNGTLIYLLIEMLQQVDSPLDWSMRLSKLNPQSAQRPLDAFFRLLFIAAGKALECDKSHGK